jgi:hypothetical protein
MYDASAALDLERAAFGSFNSLATYRPRLRRRLVRSTGRIIAEPLPAPPFTARAVADAPTAKPEDTRVRWIAPEEPVGLFAMRTFGLTLATFGVYHFWAASKIDGDLLVRSRSTVRA